MSTITEKQRYEIETNAAAFLQLRDDIEKTPVGPDFVQMSPKYEGKYSSVALVENSYQYGNLSLLSITASTESDIYTLQAMGHYLGKFLLAHGVAPAQGNSFAGPGKLGQDYTNWHNYYEFPVRGEDFARARRLTHDLLATGDIGLSPEQVAGTRLISNAEYEATLPSEKRNQPPIPHNTAERETWRASFPWPPPRDPQTVEPDSVAEAASGEQPGRIRKFLKSIRISG